MYDVFDPVINPVAPVTHSSEYRCRSFGECRFMRLWPTCSNGGALEGIGVQRYLKHTQGQNLMIDQSSQLSDYEGLCRIEFPVG
jgi:hypothetical protein